MEVKTYKAEIFENHKYRLGEGPFYDDKTGRLSWIDILDSRVYTLLNGEKKYIDCGKHIGAAIPVKDSDDYIIAGYDGLYTLSNGELKLLHSMKGEYEDFQRSNDAKMDRRGRIWFGSSVDNFYDIESYGNLYVYENGNVKCMQKDTKISNGMAWSKDDKVFYFADSTYNAVFRYDYDIETGNISNRTEFIHIDNGVPDGMTIDSNDDLWIAIWGGRRIECRDGKSGELKAIVEVDASNVSSCCFYGENKDMLFITTSGEYADGEYDGCLFTCKVDAKGV